MSSESDELQEMVTADARKLYSETVIDHAMNPRNVGSMTDADGFAEVTGPCGDTVSIWMKVNADIITGVSFMTDGCGTTVVSGSMITEMARGRSLVEAQRISQQDVLDALGGLPDDGEHCALLAANTLKAAIRDCLTMRREPWKKAYRNR